jgi:tight adherence protein B
MVSLLLTALALLCWPDTRASTRLRKLVGKAPRKRLRSPKPSAVTLLAAALTIGWLIAGPAGAVAAGLLTATIRHRLRTARRGAQALTAADGLAEALRAMTAGLRVGAHPAAAAESAAEDAQPPTDATLRAIAAAARLDGDMTRALSTVNTPSLTAALNRIAAAWQLAQRHGLPLADVLDAVRRDLEQRARFSRQVLARLAGPKASALVLSLLPALGVAMGEAMGARPVHVLTNTGTGQLLLVAGVVLLCAGVAWSGRITTKVAGQ